MKVEPTAKNKPLVLTIAANDSMGMAGVTMDVKTQYAFGLHSLVAVTANTAQNNKRVISVNPVETRTLEAQLEAIKDLPIAVVKVGLIANLAQVGVIAKFVAATQLPLVLDPVFGATSGFSFFEDKDIADYVALLLPLCELITPNLQEAERLTRLSVSSPQEVLLAAESLRAFGAKNVLLKGGHSKNGDYCQDYFASEEKCFWLTSRRQRSTNGRGTGCALASSIASSLVLGYSLCDSVVIGKMAINQGIRDSYSVSALKGPVLVRHFPNQGIDLPVLTNFAEINYDDEPFLSCDQKIGLYPVVDRAAWLERLLPLGVTTIQLRIKDLTADALAEEIAEAVKIASTYNCRLFINDHWTLAIKYKAYGVHLGQEDLVSADIAAIKAAGLRLGLSSHCHAEVASAVYYRPSYIACGPIFHTQSKKMPWIPQGVAGLSYWQSVLDYPLVAIGGINQTRITEVAQTGVDGIAMISAITEADEPELMTRSLIELMNTMRCQSDCRIE